MWISLGLADRLCRAVLGAVAAPANRRDDGLLAPTLDTLVVVGVLPARPVVHLEAAPVGGHGRR